MRKLSKIIMLLGLTLFMAFSCDEEDNVNPVEISFETLPSLSVCYTICYLSNVYLKDTVMIINEQSEYERLYECRQDELLPEIDFSKYTLIAGSQTVGGICPTILDQHLYEYPTKTKLLFELSIKDGGFTSLGNAYYHALIPKISNYYEIEVSATVEPFSANN
jgi:hypothetical protein